MMKWGMEVLTPTAYFPNSNWLVEHKKSVDWSPEENKRFEDALAFFDSETPDRWQKVAAMIPGKTEMDVLTHYNVLVDDVSDIEAGLIPPPGYQSSSFTLDWADEHGLEGLKQAYVGGKRSGVRPSDQERKKGVPWTEDEHRLFLMGLQKYGKGDWRNISRNFVTSRTPTQVASHAQKFFIRRNSGGKDKRRSSIHDITTVNLPDNRPSSPSQPPALSMESSPSVSPITSDQFSMTVDSNQPNEAAGIFGSLASQTHGNLFIQPPYGIMPYELALQAQNLHIGTLHDSMVGHHNMLF